MLESPGTDHDISSLAECAAAAGGEKVNLLAAQTKTLLHASSSSLYSYVPPREGG